MGYVDFRSLPEGINFAGGIHPTSDIRFLSDSTWIDDEGQRQLDQAIFDEVLRMIAGARRLILLDMFLFNDLLMREEAPVRPLTREMTDALIQQRNRHPEIEIIFITDPINTGWGGLPAPWFDEMRAAGIKVVFTELDCLRDSSPVYSFFWRAFIKPFGNRLGGLVPNPFGPGRITLRTLLNIPNMKANHRKTLLADDGDTWRGIVTSANPHDASFAHRNTAIAFSGPAVADLYLTEVANLLISGAEPPAIAVNASGGEADADAETTLQVLTEGRIKESVLDVIDHAMPGDALRMMLFYLADRETLSAINKASRRGVDVRIVLDPAKDAFGWSKSGIPNRPVAYRLVKRGVHIRWSDTRGEQCHTKMLIAEHADGTACVIQGSANFTRRNMNNFNLETDVRVDGPRSAAPIADAIAHFEDAWSNRRGRQLSVDYSVYEERSTLQHWLYWFMEKTGISTF